METLPGYVSIVFILTTFITVAFLLQAAKHVGLQTLPSKVLLFFLPLWIFFQLILGVSGFYQNTAVMPPRLAVFGAVPAVLFFLAFLLFFRVGFIEKLPLKYLTLLHTVRIPVEIVLYWLFLRGAVPEIMTFAGRNFDIFSGVFALIVYFVAFREGRPNIPILIVFNIFGLILLANIVSIAIFSLPTPFQQFGLDQPNRAVLHFPFNWLPSIVVPIVLFAHLAGIAQLLAKKK